MNTKKLLLHAAVLATMLTSISCSQEEVAGGQAGDESVVTFTAQLPGSPQSKAIGDGMTATSLSYAVYAQGTTTPLITSEDKVTFTNGQATISLRLASGRSYDLLFWADAYDAKDSNAPYTVDFNTQTLTIDYDAAKTLSNDESRDAFFGTTTLEVKGAVNRNVTLKRPFAQLNIGTNDMEDAANTGLNTSALRTSVKVKNVYKNLNLMNGEVGEDATVTFGENDIPEGQFTANGNTYDYLALNYLLVGTDKGVVDCEFEFTYTDGATNGSKTISKTISNVPVQRNYRTNIFGSILTGAVDLGITIDPDFETPDRNYEELLLAAQNGGSVTLTEDVTITEALTIANGVTVTIDLNGKTLTIKGEEENLHVSEGGNLTFSNGSIVADEITDPTFTLFVAGANSSVTLDGVQLTTTGTGIGPANTASNISITIRNSELHCAAYAVATNATTPVGENVKITLENSKFYGNSTVFFNIPCEVTINNCEIYGDNHGMVLRGGKATVSNSTITLEYTDDDYEKVSKFFDNSNWGTGNMLNIAALTVGNKGDGYQYPSELHLINTKVISTGIHASYFPALYSWANQGEDLGVTITFDDQTTFTGATTYGSANITVNGEPATVTEP